ncbi:MAG: Phosphoesterase (modular protein) [Promethearchaeota archaeon]|nr:MAG: Phosphoesterase (modular protein) [Candidatus Lokiarchaeota archaeon]
MNGWKILVIGDSHIPRRAKEIPESIIEGLNQLTISDLFDYTFCTGDIVRKTDFLDFLRSKTKNKFHIVMGNMDRYSNQENIPVYESLTLSDSEKPNNNDLTIGLTHGFQISPRGDHSLLENLAKERHFNILISGHTHKEEVFLTKEGILLLNPGSVTGAWSFVASEIPSFITIKIDPDFSLEVDLYRLDRKTHNLDISNFYFRFINGKIKSKY